MRRTAALATAVTALFGGLAPIAAGCSTPGTQVVDDVGIIGTYTVNGIDPRGEEYSGTVVIAAGEGTDVYVVEWLVAGAIQEGTGVLRGDRLEVDWRTISAPTGDATGTASYTVGPDGDLVGTRTIDGVDGVGTEEIFQEA